MPTVALIHFIFSRCGLGHRRLQLAQDIAQVEPAPRRACRAGARSARSSRSACDRLEQVVHRAGVEGVDRVLVVGGDEHDVRRLADALGHFQARQAGHADVEEHHLRLVLQESVPRIVAVFGHQHHLGLGPRRAQHGQQALAHQRFVFRNQDLGHHACLSIGWNGMTISATTPSARRRRASGWRASPCASCRRCRTLSRPTPAPGSTLMPTPVSCTRMHARCRRPCRADTCTLAAAQRRLDAVLDRVFDQRQHDHAGHAAPRQRFGQAQAEAQARRRGAPASRAGRLPPARTRRQGSPVRCAFRSGWRAGKRSGWRSGSAARGAPCSASCCTAPSVLNRKCGSIWARSRRNCDSLSSRAMRSRSASCWSCTVSGFIVTVSKCADDDHRRADQHAGADTAKRQRARELFQHDVAATCRPKHTTLRPRPGRRQRPSQRCSEASGACCFAILR